MAPAAIAVVCLAALAASPSGCCALLAISPRASVAVSKPAITPAFPFLYTSRSFERDQVAQTGTTKARPAAVNPAPRPTKINPKTPFLAGLSTSTPLPEMAGTHRLSPSLYPRAPSKAQTHYGFHDGLRIPGHLVWPENSPFAEERYRYRRAADSSPNVFAHSCQSASV